MPPPLVNYDGALLKKDGSLAKDQECCCGSACGFGGGYDCVLDQDSLSLIEQTLTGLGYANVSVVVNGQLGFTDWIGQCCEFDANDCETITAVCDEAFGVGSVELTFCRCVSTVGSFTAGLTEQQRTDQGGTFHAGLTCDDDPCNPLP